MAVEYLLRTLLAVAMVSMCCAQCMTEKSGKVVHNVHKHQVQFENKGCWVKGKHYKLGEEWRGDDCMKCSCSEDYINCCNDNKKPILKDPIHCEVNFNKKTCQYEVIRKDKSARHCEVESWVS